MSKGRLEAFSDGVIAIIITIMVLQLAAPRDPSITAVLALAPVFFSYVLSFIFVGIYWTNHHHLLQAVKQVDGRVLWANLHLLFWLSLIPFVTSWTGMHPLEPWPVALYGIILFFAAAAYFLLTHALIALHGPGSLLAESIGRDFKGTASAVAYLVAVPIAFLLPALAWAIYVLVAVLWLIPDRRIEKNLVR